jgi:hypothetical protein
MNLTRWCLLLLFVFCLLTFSTWSWAQGVKSATTSEKPKHAFVFHFFGGSALFYRGYLSERSSLRVGVDVGASYGDGSDQERYRSISSWHTIGDTTRYDGDSASHSIHEDYSFSAIYFYDLATTRSLTVSLGLGPLVGFGHGNSSEVGTFSRDTSEACWRNKYSYESMGALAVVGIESFVTHNLSVLGQYEIQAVYTWREYSDTSLDMSPSHFSASEWIGSSRGWEGRVNSVKIGVSVYF